MGLVLIFQKTKYNRIGIYQTEARIKILKRFFQIDFILQEVIYIKDRVQRTKYQHINNI